MRIIRHLALATVALSGCTINLYAQQHRDMASINYWHVPITNQDSSKTKIQMVDVNFDFPIYKGNKNTIFGSMELRQAHIDNFPSQENLSVYSTAYRMAYIRKVSPTLSLALFGQIGVYSDFKDVSSEDFRGMIGFQYRIKHSEQLKTGLGVAYANQFFGHQLLPYLSIDYHFKDRWYIYGQVPTNVRLEYMLGEKDFVGFGIRGLTNSYRLSKNEHNSQFIQNVDWMGKFYWEHFITKNVSFNINGGYSFIQSLRLYDDIPGDMLNSWTIITFPVGKKRPDPVHEIKKNSFMFQLGVSYNVFNNKN